VLTGDRLTRMGMDFSGAQCACKRAEERHTHLCFLMSNFVHGISDLIAWIERDWVQTGRTPKLNWLLKEKQKMITAQIWWSRNYAIF